MPKDTKPTLSRRTALAGAGTAGALAAAAVVLPMAQGARDGARDGSGASADAQGEQGRYRETAHVMHYYQTARV